MSGKIIYLSGKKHTNSPIVAGNWDEQFSYKVGTEYQLTKTVIVRCGYKYGKTYVDSHREFETLSFPAIAEYHITAGLGWDITPNITLNLALIYSPPSTVKTSNSAQMIDSVKTLMDQFMLDIGLTCRF